MTTMQEALADRFLAAAEVPDFLQQTADLMQRTFSNEKYGNEGLRLSDSNNQTSQGAGGIPSKRQNKSRSGKSSRRAARNRQLLQSVGGLSYRGPWDVLKASSKPADYTMCRIKEVTK